MIKEAGVKHAPLISNLLTEELLRSEIAPHLPEGLYISKGEVVDGAGSSGDCDLIIYQKPVIYQYGPVAIVPRESARAIIDVEIHGEVFLKAFYRSSAPSRRVAKKKDDVERLRRFADKVLCLGLHAHANTEEFRLWIENRHSAQIPTFILYTRSDKRIIEGEFERLVKEIQSLRPAR
jgi:hypothetical protein